MKLALAPRRHWHGLVVVAVALVVIAAIVALPAGVRLLAVRQIEQLTGREVSIANVDLNLFTRHLVVHELRVAGTHNGPPVVALARLDARFGLWALVRGRIQLMSVDVDDPLVRLRREAQGELNIEDIVARIASRPPAEEPWHFTVEQLAVHDGRIVFEDAEAEPTYSWEATDLRLELADVGTDLDQGRASLTFQVAGARAGMELTGITVRPLAARFVATLDGFEIAIMRHYIPRDAPVRITGGVLTTRTEGRYHAREGAVVSGRTTIKGATVEREESGGTFLRLPEATATAREVRWRNGVASADRLELTTSVTLLAGGADAGHEPHEIEIAPVHLVIDGVQHPASAPGRVTLTAGLPDDGTLDARGTATIEPLDADLDVSLAGLDLTLARPFLPGDAAITIGSGRASATFDIRASGARLTADGDFAIGDLRLFRRGQTQPFILDRRVSGTIDGLTLARGDVMAGTATLTGTPTIVDASRGEPQRFELRRLEARIADVTWPARDPSRVAIDAAIADGGTVSVQGLFDPSSLAANVEAEVADLDLTRFTPYVPADAPLALGRGVASARVRVTHARDAGVAIEGSAMLHDLVLLRRGQGDAFISDPSLEIAVSGLRIDDGVVRMERTTVRGAPQVIIAGADGVHHPVQFSSSDISIEDGGWPGPTTARVEAAATLVSGGRSSLQGSVDLPTLKARGRATFDDLVLSVINTFLPPDGFVRIAHGLLDATVEFTQTARQGSCCPATASLPTRRSSAAARTTHC
jgi:hypothetical protein